MDTVFSQMESRELSLSEYAKALLVCMLNEGTNCDLHTLLEDDIKDTEQREKVYKYLREKVYKYLTELTQ